MSKLGEKERKELRRRAFELHLQDDQLIAVGHVAIRSAITFSRRNRLRGPRQRLRYQSSMASSPAKALTLGAGPYGS